MSALAGKLDELLWSSRYRDSPLPIRLLCTAARFIYAVARDLISGQLTLRAMSLVYTTLLSVVPLLAFSFSVLKGFGIHEELRPRLYAILEPLGDQGTNITNTVIETVEKVQGSVLGTLSLAFFLFTAIAMVQKIESSFNYVWHVARPRSIARRITEYLSVLLVGPVIMVTALGMIASIENNILVKEIIAIEPFGTTMLLAGKIVPYVLVMSVFTFLYKFLPNANVRWRSALTGGTAAGIMWSFTGAVFASVVALSTTRNAIYGTFAVAISALIWLYVSWLILLIGAQIAFYAQNPIYLRIGRREPQLSNELKERIALNSMFLVGRAFRNPELTCTARTISNRISIPGMTIGPILAALEDAGLLTANERDELVPGREMARIRLGDILAAVRTGGETGSLLPPQWSTIHRQPCRPNWHRNRRRRRRYQPH